MLQQACDSLRAASWQRWHAQRGGIGLLAVPPQQRGERCLSFRRGDIGHDAWGTFSWRRVEDWRRERWAAAAVAAFFFLATTPTVAARRSQAAPSCPQCGQPSPQPQCEHRPAAAVRQPGGASHIEQEAFWQRLRGSHNSGSGGSYSISGGAVDASRVPPPSFRGRPSRPAHRQRADGGAGGRRAPEPAKEGDGVAGWAVEGAAAAAARVPAGGARVAQQAWRTSYDTRCCL